MKEKILLGVHLNAARRWAESQAPYSEDARALLDRIEGASSEYDRTIPVEGDLWEPEHNPNGATFSWDNITSQLNQGDEIDISGVQRDLCVKKVEVELTKRGFSAKIRRDLTIDLDD